MKTTLLWAVPALLAAAEPAEIPLWPNGAPGSEGKVHAEKLVPAKDEFRRIYGIHNPSITPYLPPKESATGAAVIIMPGGGHRYLSIDNEGVNVAKWLNERGIAGIVLKSRLAREEGSTYSVEVHSLQDAQRAIRVVRNRAKAWNIHPERIGVIGFSAGGQLAALAAGAFDSGKADAADPVERESSRPAFQALIYSAAPGPKLAVPKEGPPAFIAVAFDDRGPAGTSIDLYQKLRDAGTNVELHIYSSGGHGFGMKNRPLPVTSWSARFHDWLTERGFLRPPETTRATYPK